MREHNQSGRDVKALSEKNIAINENNSKNLSPFLKKLNIK